MDHMSPSAGKTLLAAKLFPVLVVRKDWLMTTIESNGDQVTISITGWDKVFSLKGEVTFPRTSVTKVYAFDKSLSPPWLRSPATAILGIIIAGTYRDLRDRKEFCVRIAKA